MALQESLEKYSSSPQGFWMSLFDWRAVKIRPLKFQLQGIITALYFSPLNTIFAAPDKDHRVYFGTVCHELYHAHQRHTMGLVKYLFFKCFLRNKLEATAKEIQLQAVQWACAQGSFFVLDIGAQYCKFL